MYSKKIIILLIINSILIINLTGQEKENIPNKILLKQNNLPSSPKKKNFSLNLIVDRLMDPNLYFAKSEISLNYYYLFQEQINLNIKPEHLGKIWEVDIIYDSAAYKLTRLNITFIPKDKKALWRFEISYTYNSLSTKLYLQLKK